MTYRIGPTVWDEDGPTPIENRSNVLITAWPSRGFAFSARFEGGISSSVGMSSPLPQCSGAGTMVDAGSDWRADDFTPRVAVLAGGRIGIRDEDAVALVVGAGNRMARWGQDMTSDWGSSPVVGGWFESWRTKGDGLRKGEENVARQLLYVASEGGWRDDFPVVWKDRTGIRAVHAAVADR